MQLALGLILCFKLSTRLQHTSWLTMLQLTQSIAWKALFLSSQHCFALFQLHVVKVMPEDTPAAKSDASNCALSSGIASHGVGAGAGGRQDIADDSQSSAAEVSTITSSVLLNASSGCGCDCGCDDKVSVDLAPLSLLPYKDLCECTFCGLCDGFGNRRCTQRISRLLMMATATHRGVGLKCRPQPAYCGQCREYCLLQIRRAAVLRARRKRTAEPSETAEPPKRSCESRKLSPINNVVQ